jgi:hypothetical protein
LTYLRTTKVKRPTVTSTNASASSNPTGTPAIRVTASFAVWVGKLLAPHTEAPLRLLKGKADQS